MVGERDARAGRERTGLDEMLAIVELQTARIEAEDAAFAGTQTYPDSWKNEAIPMGPVWCELKDPETNPTVISHCFGQWQRQRESGAVIMGHGDDTSSKASG